MSRRWFFGGHLQFWLGAICAGFGVADAQTLNEAVVTAYHSNPNLLDARLGVRSAHEDVWQARAGYLPSVTLQAAAGERDLDIETAPTLTNPTGRTEFNQDTSSAAAIVTQQLYTGGRRGGQMRLAHAGERGARETLRASEQDVLLGVIRVYANLVRDQGVVRVREAYLSSLNTQLAAAQRRLDLGEVTRTDVSQSQARAAAARAQLAQARANAEASRAAYVEVIGAEPEGVLLPADAAASHPPDSLEEALTQANATNPKIRQARENEHAALARVQIERAANRPQLSVIGRADTQENTDQLEQRRESSSVQAQVTVPLFTGGYDWARTRQSHINVSRARAQTEARRREVAADVTAAWNEVGASREIAAAAAEQVRASADAVAGAERELGLGTRSNTEVLDARLDLQQAQIVALEAQARASVASYALLAQVGALSFEEFGVAQQQQD